MDEYIKVDEVCRHLLYLANEFDKNDQYCPERHLGEKAKTLRMLSEKFYGFPGNIEIVKCKDCIYNYGIANNCEYAKDDIVCCYWESDGLHSDDFCSKGKRREAE